VAFPRIRASELLPPNNLPLQLTSFVGREREIAEVNRLFAGNRLLPLTGPRGCGKPFPYVASSSEHSLTTSPSSGTGKKPPGGSGLPPSAVSSSASNAAR
jgi:hypothetical protein